MSPVGAQSLVQTICQAVLPPPPPAGCLVSRVPCSRTALRHVTAAPVWVAHMSSRDPEVPLCLIPMWVQKVS